MKAFSNRRYALHVQVRFCGRPVDDRVIPRQRESLRLGGEGELLLPPPHDAPQLAEVRWIGPERVEIVEPSGQRTELGLDQQHTLRSAAGPGLDLEVDLDLVRQFRLPRPPMVGEGDLVLAVAILAMTVLGLQLAILLNLLQPPGGGAAHVPETSPELIARLLQEDYEGYDRGQLADRQDRPETEKSVQSFYLPAGNDGPMEDLGGAERTAPEPVRTPNTEVEEAPSFQPLPPEPQVPAISDEPDALQVEGVSEPQNLIAPEEDQQDEDAEPEKVAAEEERGWGLYDWYDAEDARHDASEIAQEIRAARQRLAIDPDSSWALQQLGYYQYLAEDYEACRETYERFIELYGEEPAGYNNLALVYKRIGEYAKEEGYYRLALALDPDDDHALNNLAVNLAHQGRFSEAIAIMDQLEELIPGDAYADLHRAKIHAARGDEDTAFAYLQKALEGMAKLDTLHHIEFRQDIRIDPAFAELRQRPAFGELLLRYYGQDAAPLIGNADAGGFSG